MASAALLPDAEADVRALGKASQRQPDAGHRRCQRAVEPLLQGRPAAPKGRADRLPTAHGQGMWVSGRHPAAGIPCQVRPSRGHTLSPPGGAALLWAPAS
jgi:hypothetical protein